MDATRGMYLDVETVDTSDFEAPAGRPSRWPSAAAAARIAGAVTLLLGAVAAAALASASAGAGRAAAAARAETADAVVLSSAPESSSALRPLELLHDGNVCDMNEELYGGLCYKKCSLLTQGAAAVRTSPWSCCEGSPCTFAKEHAGAPLPCHGFDVSGSGGCPHKPGACLVDEEMYLGECFKKCSLLTDGAYTFRTAPATCCKTKGLGCLIFRNDRTSSSFAVGGGAGDHDPSTPSSVHLPMKSLTESEAAQQAARASAAGSASASASAAAASAVAVSQGDLKPLENTHDGNVCPDQEELHDGLCYKQCALLTNGEAAIRTSPWTCCESRPCGLKNQLGEVGSSILCNGFDVSADGKCPHKPGACLTDEEMFLGVCYKRCSLLTAGVYAHRVGAASCCKSASGLGCLNFFNDKTSPSFAVGGGSGEEAKAHAPEEDLTEAAPAAGAGETRASGALSAAAPATTPPPSPSPVVAAAAPAASKLVFGVPSAASMHTLFKKRMLRSSE